MLGDELVDPAASDDQHAVLHVRGVGPGRSEQAHTRRQSRREVRGAPSAPTRAPVCAPPGGTGDHSGPATSPGEGEPPSSRRERARIGDPSIERGELLGDALGRLPPGSERAATASSGVGSRKRSPAATRLATRSCASRNGTPSRTSASATSVATHQPSPAAAAGARRRSGVPVPAARRPRAPRRARRPARTAPPCPPAGPSRRPAGSPLTTARKPVRRPIAMPARPRRCSATCGFFFCGIIELAHARRDRRARRARTPGS